MPSTALRVWSANLRRWIATAVVVAVTAVGVAVIWQYYVVAPWTRDGRVRVLVASVAPQVSGQIVELRVTDNQVVKKGDVLYVIDPFDFRVAVESADAEVENREADVQVKGAQSARRQALTTLSTSVEEKQQFAGTAKIADAALRSARARQAQANVNLRRTQVRSPVDGYVTNLQLRVGDYAVAGTANVAVIDRHSYWVDGYFEETKLARICVGDEARVELMGFPDPIRGRVESFGRGISVSNAASSTQNLPAVDPIYTWVRLAQRVPVRIAITAASEGVFLASGLTATVRIESAAKEAGAASEGGSHPAWPTIKENLRRALATLYLGRSERRACVEPDNVERSPPTKLPYDDGEELLSSKRPSVPALPMNAHP